jgi:CRISPR system Cascade subunit CasE
MYLSHLLIDVGDNPDRPNWNITRRWLRNLYRVHQRLCMAFAYPETKAKDPDFLKPYQPCAFPDPRPDYSSKPVEKDLSRPCSLVENPLQVPRDKEHNFIFRVEPHSCGRVVILVQSAAEPDWEYAFHNADYFLAALPQYKRYDPDFEKNQHLQFRLLANPTKRLRKDSRERNGEPVQAKWVGKRVPVGANQLVDWLSRRAEDRGFSVDPDNIQVQPGYVYVDKRRNDQKARLRSARYDGILTVNDPEKFLETIVSGIGPAKGFGFGLLSVIPVSVAAECSRCEQDANPRPPRPAEVS